MYIYTKLLTSVQYEFNKFFVQSILSRQTEVKTNSRIFIVKQTCNHTVNFHIYTTANLTICIGASLLGCQFTFRVSLDYTNIYSYTYLQLHMPICMMTNSVHTCNIEGILHYDTDKVTSSIDCQMSLNYGKYICTIYEHPN